MKTLLTIALLLLAFQVDAAATLTLKWTYAPDTCANGEPLKECPITGFEIQEQKAGNPIWAIIKGVGPKVFEYTIPDTLAAGEVRCYRMRVNAGGSYSVPSKEFCTSPIPSSEPKTITSVDISIVIKSAP